MIITKQYAQRLIRAGNATAEGRVYSDGRTYMAIVRHDKQRMDHYLIGASDLRR